MITLINKESLYNTFRVDSFSSLNSIIDNMAPSLVEYHLFDLSEQGDETYFNKRDIENGFSVGIFSLYLDYSENIYLEFDEQDSSDSTQQIDW